MDRRIIEDQHIIARYLAGQLDAAECAAFEEHYAQNPETVRAIERALRLREGLAVLSERGELDALLRGRPFWKPAVGLAAGVAMLVIAAWLWVGHTSVAPIVSTVAALNDAQGRPVRVASTHVLVRMRGATATLEIPLPRERAAVELRMVPALLPKKGGFRVRLGKLDAANEIAPLAETRATASPEDGFVTAYLDSARLTRGRYAIDLVPERSSAPGAPTDRFIIELR